MSYVAIIITLGAVACVAFGLYLIVTSRRKVEPGPRCGQCGYNLTGATANRCPECGRPFIEAGIVTNPVTSLRKRRWIGITLLVAPLIPVSLGLATTMFYRARAARQIAAAEKAKAAVLNRFYTDMLTSVDPGTYPSSAPARSLDEQPPSPPRP